MCSNVQSTLLMLVLGLALLANSARAATSGNGDELGRDYEERSLARSRLVAVPNALTRFLLYNSGRPNERLQALAGSGNPFGSKRSSSALDALTGVTLGKRSVGGAPQYAELINLDPFFSSRQYTLRSLLPRLLVASPERRAAWTQAPSTEAYLDQLVSSSN